MTNSSDRLQAITYSSDISSSYLRRIEFQNGFPNNSRLYLFI